MRGVLRSSLTIQTLPWGVLFCVVLTAASSRGAPPPHPQRPPSRKGAAKCRLDRVGSEGVFLDAIRVEGSLAKALHRKPPQPRDTKEKGHSKGGRAGTSYCASLLGAWSWDAPCRRALREAVLGCLRAASERKGHYAPKLEVYLQRRGAALDVVVEGDAGPRFVVGSLDVSGVSQKLRLTLLGKVTTRSGHGFSKVALRQDVETLERYFRARGYAYAIVTPGVRKNPRLQRVDVDFHVFKGPKVRVFELRIQGASASGRLLIRRAVSLKRGDFYKGDDLQRAMKRLRATGAFRSVKLGVFPWRVAGGVFLRVTVEEGSFSLHPRPAVRRGADSPSRGVPRP
jgi:hypothetical protein